MTAGLSAELDPKVVRSDASDRPYVFQIFVELSVLVGQRLAGDDVSLQVTKDLIAVLPRSVVL